MQSAKPGMNARQCKNQKRPQFRRKMRKAMGLGFNSEAKKDVAKEGAFGAVLENPPGGRDGQ
ncbi:MAG: hypothetical protein M1840_008909 [Geoglossum simile]|nr:MAG: hypothetical protein M1840_008909 [Geoglossum simile]